MEGTKHSNIYLSQHSSTSPGPCCVFLLSLASRWARTHPLRNAMKLKKTRYSTTAERITVWLRPSSRICTWTWVGGAPDCRLPVSLCNGVLPHTSWKKQNKRQKNINSFHSLPPTSASISLTLVLYNLISKSLYRPVTLGISIASGFFFFYYYHNSRFLTNHEQCRSQILNEICPNSPRVFIVEAMRDDHL